MARLTFRKWLWETYKLSWRFPDRDIRWQVFLARAYVFGLIVAFCMALVVLAMFITVLT